MYEKPAETVFKTGYIFQPLRDFPTFLELGPGTCLSTSDGGNGNHNVSLPIILIKI